MKTDKEEEDPLGFTTVKNEVSSDDLRHIIHDPDLSDLEGDLTSPSYSGSQLDKRVGSQEDDLAANDMPDSDSEERYMDFSDGSSDDYEPRNDNLETSNVEELFASGLERNVSEPSYTTTSQTHEAGPWVRVYPPEPEQDVTTKFAIRNVGPRNLPQNGKPLDFLNLFMTTAMWSLMVRETNKNAQAVLCQRHVAGTYRQHSRFTKWVDVTVGEMKKFWAILINMGLTGRKNLKHYWDCNLSQTISFYPKTMSLRRFQLIMSMFHLSSNDCPQRGQPGYNPWMKIRDFVNMMNESFKKYFVPGQEVCIDESMIGMKNRCSFIQYIPNERYARFGIKKFQICDFSTSYVLHVSLYSGKDFLAENIEPFQKVVMELLTQAHCLGNGYHLFIDNYYSKIPLCRFLLSKNTYLTGMVNIKSKELSQKVVQAKLRKGRVLYFRKGNTLLMKYREKETKHLAEPVYVVTTACHAEDVVVRYTNNGVRTKPMLSHRYKTFMSWVNNKDKSFYHLTCSRPCNKYWRTIVYNFVDMAIQNAWILFKAQNPMYKKSWHGFVIEIVEQLCLEPGVVDPIPVLLGDPLTIPPPSTSTSTLTSLSSHILTKLPGSNQRTFCGVCKEDKGIKGTTLSWCPPCNVGVHKKCFDQMQHFYRPGNIIPAKFS